MHDVKHATAIAIATVITFSTYEAKCFVYSVHTHTRIFNPTKSNKNRINGPEVEVMMNVNKNENIRKRQMERKLLAKREIVFK